MIVGAILALTPIGWGVALVGGSAVFGAVMSASSIKDSWEKYLHHEAGQGLAEIKLADQEAVRGDLSQLRKSLALTATDVGMTAFDVAYLAPRAVLQAYRAGKLSVLDRARFEQAARNAPTETAKDLNKINRIIADRAASPGGAPVRRLLTETTSPGAAAGNGIKCGNAKRNT